MLYLPFSTGCCYFLSSAINPFMYSLLSKRFRRGFHDLKYKILQHFRVVSSRTTSSGLSVRRQTRPIISIRNKQSIRFRSRQQQTQHVLNRPFDRPTSVPNELDDKIEDPLEMEMSRFANEINCKENFFMNLGLLIGLPNTYENYSYALFI